MAKYYIPISSLNVENILSTESISPACFYQYRQFGDLPRGSQRFADLENYPKDRLLLFSKVPSFEIHDEERINYPVVVEVEDDGQLESEKKREISCRWKHVCEYYGTIQLTPMNCRLLFFTQEARDMVREACMSSANCKLVEYFKFDVVKDNSDFKLETVLERCEELRRKVLCFEKEDYEQDNRLDRAKGFIYGYYMGIVKSKGKFAAQLLKCQKEVIDVVGAINNRGEVTLQDSERLKEISKERMLAEFDNNKEGQTRWKEYVEECGCSVEGLRKIESDYGNYENMLWQFCGRNNIKLSMPYTCGMDVWEFDNALKSQVEVQMKEDRMKMRDSWKPEYLDACVESVMLADEKMDKEAQKKAAHLFNCILNKIVWDGDVIPNLGVLRSNRYECASEVTRRVKAIFEGEGWLWDGSSAQDYFDHLRRNISDGERFELREINNVVLQSLTAFVLKGDDFGELISYLEGEAFCDYRYALALWGAVNGYWQMSRRVFATIDEQAELPGLYKDAYQLLWKRELKGELKKAVWKQQGSMRGWESLEIRKDDGRVRNVSEKEKFMALVKGKCGKPANEEKVWESYVKYGGTQRFLNDIQKLSGLGKKKADLIADALGIPYESGRKDTYTDLFHNKVEESTYWGNERKSTIEEKYKDIGKVVENILKGMEISARMKTSIIENAEYIGRYIKSNVEKERKKGKDYFPINHFGNLCFSSNAKENKLDSTNENRQIIRMLQEKLKEYYANR